MIQVNLLPAEYRTANRAPLSRMLGVALGVALAAGSMMLFVWIKVVLVQNEQRRKEDKGKEVARLKVKAEEYNKLKALKTQREARLKRIDEIKQKDPKYARLLAEMTQLVWAGDEEGKFKVWFLDMMCTAPKRARGRAAGEHAATIKLNAYCAGKDGKRLAEYYLQFRTKRPFLKQDLDVANITPPEYKVDDFKNFDPAYAMSFSVQVSQFAAAAKSKRAAEEAKRKASQATAAKPAPGKATPVKGGK
jgi:hypothetical protein